MARDRCRVAGRPDLDDLVVERLRVDDRNLRRSATEPDCQQLVVWRALQRVARRTEREARRYEPPLEIDDPDRTAGARRDVRGLPVARDRELVRVGTTSRQSSSPVRGSRAI